MVTTLSGFLLILGVLLPHFGHSFDLGIHNRALGWFFLLGSVLTAIPSFNPRRANTVDLVIAICTLGIIVLAVLFFLINALLTIAGKPIIPL